MDEEILESYKIVVKALADYLGPNVEVVLHDVTNSSSKIIAIENGYITGRSIGDSLTESGRIVIKKLEEGLDYFGPYKSLSSTKKNLRSITIAIRNKKKKIIGLLCLNMDISTLESIGNFIEPLLNFKSGREEVFLKKIKDQGESLESIFNEVYSVLTSKVVGGKVDNYTIIKELYNNDFFKFKNSVEFVANKLNISIFTVYSHLRKIRRESGR